MTAQTSRQPEQKKLSSFTDLLGIELLEAQDGRSRLTMVVAERHSRSYDMAHGGATATLFDSAVGIAAHSLAPPGHYTVTIQLNMHFARAAAIGDTLTATGQVHHSGRRTAVSHGQIHNQKNQLVATGSATMMYLPLSEQATAEE